MAELTSEYRYIGRSNPVTCPAGWKYYLLLYAKTYADTATGKHTVTVRQRLVCDVESTFYHYATSGGITVDGVSAVSWSWQSVPSAPWNTTSLTEDGVTYKRWIDLKETAAVVDTGYGAEKTVTVSAYWVMESQSQQVWFPETGVRAKVEAAVTLPMIAGATQPAVSAQQVYLGDTLTVTTPAAAATLTHDLAYSFAGGDYVHLATGVGASYSWQLPMTLARSIPSKTSGALVIRCTTRAGSTVIGTRSVSLTACVPESAVPTVSAQWEDASGAKETMGVYVQNVSRLAVTVSAGGSWGSTVTGTAMTLGASPYYGGVLTAPGELTLTVTVTDSRGRTATAAYPISVAAYSAPQVSVNASRCREDGTPDDTGDHAILTVTGRVTPVDGKNTASLGLTWGYDSQEISVSPGDISVRKIVYADPDATLAIRAVLSDSLLSAAGSMTLSTGYATMDFLKGGRGVSIGKAATAEGFECAMAATFTGGINHLFVEKVSVSGAAAFQIQTKFSQFSGMGHDRHSLFLFGTANHTPVYGLLTIHDGGVATWTGEGSVTGTAREGGIVEITLPTTCWDRFVLISGDTFGIV